MKTFINLFFSFTPLYFFALVLPLEVSSQNQAKKVAEIYVSAGIGYSKNFSEILNQLSTTNYSAQSVPVRGLSFGIAVDLVQSNWALSLGMESYRLGDFTEVMISEDNYEGSVFMSNYKRNYYLSGFLGYRMKIHVFHFVPSIGILYSTNSHLENAGGVSRYFVAADTIEFRKKMNSVRSSPFVYGANLKLSCPIKINRRTFYINYEFLFASAIKPIYKTEGDLFKNGNNQLTYKSHNLSRLVVHSLHFAFQIDYKKKSQGKTINKHS